VIVPGGHESLPQDPGKQIWRGGPPWWPHGRDWPPAHHRFSGNRRVRARFFRSLALVAFVYLLALTFAVYVVSSWVTSRVGVAMWMPIVPVLVLMLVGAMAIAGMRRFAFPLRSVMEAADRVAGGDYSARVQEHGPPAMRALSHSFNAMTERLQSADRQRRDLMADLAHELRTPLTVLQGRIEGLLDDVYPRNDDQLRRLLDETHVLSRLIEDLRTLALSDAGVLVLQREPTDLGALVRDIARRFEPDAARASLSLTTTALDVAVDVDPVRIREVLSNLLSNALRHTPPGGSVDVVMTATATSVSIDVRDTGTGLTADALARVFDRFYKGEQSHGSGLGLTIARSLARAHGGDITAVSQPGAGTTMTVALPRSTDS
jgi:two-component system OmpR family sensor kinase/two-component system sensor histidine kinase BaeS